MNLNCFTGTVFTVAFKIVIKQGVTVSSILLFRSFAVILFALAMLKGTNPFKDFPWSTRTVKIGLIRFLSGQINFLLLNLALPLLPLGLLNIIHKTSPFW